MSCEGQEEVAGNSRFPEVEVRGIVAQPQLPRDAVRQVQLDDPSMNWIVKSKEESSSRPPWEIVSGTSGTHKTLWSLWDQLQMRDGVLCRSWESDDGKSVR